jgi:hypothetical protein
MCLLEKEKGGFDILSYQSELLKTRSLTGESIACLI